MFRYHFIFIFVFIVTVLFSQETITPEQAVALALSNNYDIVLAKNDVEIAKLNNTPGAAGQLPNIGVSISDNFSFNNIYQELSTGLITNKSNVPVNNLSAGLVGSWTVFDGLKMFATKDKLNAMQTQSELQLKDQIQNTVAQTLSVYYQIVQQKMQLNALEELIKLYETRVSLSEKKFEVGYADKSALLQAKVEMASQQINIVKQKTLLQQTKASLNQLLSRNPATEFDVLDTFVIESVPSLAVLMDSTKMNNALQVAQKNIEIARYQTKEINSMRMPTINLNTAYAFNQNNSKAGLQLVNRSYGPQVGFSTVVPIYSGNIVKKQLDANKVQIASNEIMLEQLKNELNTNLFSAYKNYENAIATLKLTEENTKVAKENVQLALEKFKLNQATSIDLKTAQNSMEQALYEVILSRYNAKIAEIELKRISNILVKG